MQTECRDVTQKTDEEDFGGVCAWPFMCQPAVLLVLWYSSCGSTVASVCIGCLHNRTRRISASKKEGFVWEGAILYTC